MVVVLGHDANIVAAVLGERPFHRVECDADLPMFGSIRAGLETALAIDLQATVVLQPGDHPEVRHDTLNMLSERSHQHPLQAIIPEYRGRGGHPVIIPSSVATRILDAHCPTGLGDFWRENPALCLRIPLHDPAVCLDIDTPADLPKDRSIQ
jgi:molybdenum cofactor cytidylyltransferase